MSTKPSPTRLPLADSLRTALDEEEPAASPTAPENDQFSSSWPRFNKRAFLAITCSLIAFFIGVAVTLAWQSYAEATRQMIAPASLNALSLDLDAVRQGVDRISNNTASSQQEMAHSIDQLAAQVAAGQDQMARDFIATLQAAERDIFDKISTRPATVPVPVLRPSRAANAVTPARNP